MGLKLACVALALLLLWSVHDSAAAKGVAAEREHVADSVYLVAIQAQHDATERARALEYEVVRLYVERDSAVAAADRAAQRRPRIVERIVEVAGDSAAVVEAVAELETAHHAEVSNLRLALFQSDSIIAAERARADAAWAANQQLERALEASRSEARAWERAAKPRVPTWAAFVVGVGLGVAAL